MMVLVGKSGEKDCSKNGANKLVKLYFNSAKMVAKNSVVAT